MTSGLKRKKAIRRQYLRDQAPAGASADGAPRRRWCSSFVVGRYGALYRFGRRDVTSTESRQDRALVALVNKKNIRAFEGNAIGFDIAWKTAQT